MARGLAPSLGTDMVLLHIRNAPLHVVDQMQSRLRHLCQIAPDQPSQPSPPFNETRVYRVLFTLGTFLVILTATCALYFLLCLIPSPTSTPDAETLSPTLPEQRTTPRGAKQGAIQGPTSPSGNRPIGDQSLDGARVSISSAVGGTSSIQAGSGRRTQTSGVHAGSGDNVRPGLQDNSLPVADARPHVPLSLDSRRDLSPKPTSTVVSNLHQRVAPSPVQAEHPPSNPTIGSRKTIIKSLYPQDRDETLSPLAHSLQQPQLVPLGEAPLAAAHHLVTWFILVIAVSAGGLQDPEADLRFIIQAFKSPKVHLVSLLNAKATHTSIRHELRQLYLQAQRNPGSQILVYLTGSGDSSGNMTLFGCMTISAQDLRLWLAELCAESTDPPPTLGVIFDICRDIDVGPNPQPDLDLAIVWSCSIGQWAYALKLGQNLPSSCFLLSLFLAAHDSGMEPTDFEYAFESRLAQQGALLRFIYDKRHKSACIRCSTSDPCCMPSPQEAEYRQSGRDMFLRLGDLIRVEFPDVARLTHAEITRKMTRWKFLDPEPWYGSFPVWGWMRHLVYGLAIKHPRGSTAAVAQAAPDLL